MDPHIFLQSKYPDEFHVEIDFQPPVDNMEFWKKYQIVHYHRAISQNYDYSAQLVEKLNAMGIITICDIDDYWLPTKDHPIHDIIVFNKINEKIVANLKVAKYVTTTTPHFADEIRKQTPEHDKLRIGWLGGSSHLADLQLLDGSFAKIVDKKDKYQFVLCGFDTRGTITEIIAQTGEHKKRDIKPEETVWARYEEIFTQKYKTISPEYQKKLMLFQQQEYPEFIDESYRRGWSLPVTSYAKNYSKFDVSLAPIKNHIFNRMKSQLKIIEAGFYKKAIIASNVGPYTIDLKHCLENGKFVDGNAMLVNEARNHADWAKYINNLIANPNMVKDMGERLYETVKDTYDLNTVTKTRADLYKSLVK